MIRDVLPRRIWCWAIVASMCVLLTTPAFAIEALGFYRRGEQLTVDLSRILPRNRLIVEINGAEIPVKLRVSGNELTLIVPQEVAGTRHELAIYQDVPGEDQLLGRWLFTTPASEQRASGHLTLDFGARGGGGRSYGYGLVIGRADFEDGASGWRGGIGITYAHNLPRTGDTVERIDDYYLEYHRPLPRADLTLRFGSHYLPSDTGALDGETRRGVSALITDPSRRNRARLFALQASASTSPKNFSGLAKADDRVLGFSAVGYPVGGRNLRVEAIAYGGSALKDSDNVPIDTRLAGVFLSGDLDARGRIGLELGLNAAQWSYKSDGPEKTGRDQRVQLTFGLLAPENSNTLDLILYGRQTEQDFYAALNPGLPLGRQTVGARMNYSDALWQISGRYEVARTNHKGPDSSPTDRIQTLALDVVHDPDVFTGGFLNGTVFFGSMRVTETRRLKTPFGSDPAKDNTIFRFSAGIDRSQPDRSWTLVYRLSHIDDQTAGDVDVLIRGLNGIYAYTPSDTLSFTAQATIAQEIVGEKVYHDREVSLGLSWDFVPDTWRLSADLGVTEFGDPSRADGRYAQLELGYEPVPDCVLYVGARYGNGRYQSSYTEEDGWEVFFGLRRDFGVARHGGRSRQQRIDAVTGALATTGTGEIF